MMEWMTINESIEMLFQVLLLFIILTYRLLQDVNVRL
jgi:hypothetical protein